MEPTEQLGLRPGFDRRMTREEINRLPILRYEGPVQVVRTREDLRRAVAELREEKVLGFDMEARPSFSKGQEYPPSLIQLIGGETGYIFQLRFLKFPRLLRGLLSDANIVKAGVALHQDIARLKQLGSFEDAGFVDLGDSARDRGIKNHGLRGLAAVLLGAKISKKAQLSNWARANLTPEQITYAATDAWIGRELYLRMAAGEEIKPSGAG